MRLVTSADDNCISNNKIINVSEASATVNDGNGYTSNPSVMDQPLECGYDDEERYTTNNCSIEPISSGIVYVWREFYTCERSRRMKHHKT